MAGEAERRIGRRHEREAPDCHEREAPVIIGRIRRAHGVEGEVVVESFSDFPERFAGLREVLLISPRSPGRPRRVRVTGVKEHPAGTILRLDGITTPERAGALRGSLLGVPREEAMPLQPGEYYAFDLVGLEVVSTTGTRLGRIRDVLRYPANDVYEVWDEEKGREILLPAVTDVVRDVDLARGRMTVELLEGLGE